MMRQSLLTNDLANADTPGFAPQDVNFGQTLAQALASGQSPTAVSFTPFAEPGATTANGNGVSPDQIQSTIAENALLYQELAQVTAAREQILKSAINTAG